MPKFTTKSNVKMTVRTVQSHLPSRTRRNGRCRSCSVQQQCVQKPTRFYSPQWLPNRAYMSTVMKNSLATCLSCG